MGTHRTIKARPYRNSKFRIQNSKLEAYSQNSRLALKSDNIILEKSFGFAVRIVRLYKYLYRHSEHVMSKQLLRCGTSIGANVREALRGQSRNDFLAKMNIALKEAYETEYWLELLHTTEYINDAQFESIFSECRDITNILSKIVITTKTIEK